MANYNDKVESLINGLSDFWLLYFKEIDTLRTMYKGAEIEIGQVYLDLLTLLLNNSLQDTTIFNKEYFKLLRVKENDVLLKKGINAEADKYEITLPEDTRDLGYLNNKVFNADRSINTGSDFSVDDGKLKCNFDVTNAYEERIIEAPSVKIRVKSLVEGKKNIRVSLSVLSDKPTVSVEHSNTYSTIQVVFDTSTHTAKQLVRAINLHPVANTLITAEVFEGNEDAVFKTTGDFSLNKVPSNPINGFAARNLEHGFGGKFTDPGIDDWVAEGIEKGDYLRVFSGLGRGATSDYRITLVRKDALYVDAEKPIPQDATGKVDYAIVRKADHYRSFREPIADSGDITTVTDVDLDSTTKTLSVSSGSPFEPVLVGDLVKVKGRLNIGYFTILDVVSPTEIIISAASLVEETGIEIDIYSPVTATGTLDVTNNEDGTASAVINSASYDFDDASVGDVLRIIVDEVIHRYEIISIESTTEAIITADEFLPISTEELESGLANAIPSATTLVFSFPNYWNEPSVEVRARREIDDNAVTQGIDYTVSSKKGTITPLTVWKASTSNTATYDYDKTIFHVADSIQSGTDGTLTAASTNTFSSPTANFNNTHVGYAIKISNSSLSGATNNGIHFIAAVVDANTVELTEDKVVSSTTDGNNGSLEWELLRRGAAETEAITTVSEVAFWAPDVLVDRYHLYNTYGYLIKRFDKSSEQYRALVRGIFQLFMLGPTLERFESAINTVAGLPVIKHDDELLLSYDDNSELSASDGEFDFSSRVFSSDSYEFRVDDLGKQIYASSGPNTNALYTIEEILDIHTVRLREQPVTDSSVEWELTSTGTHKIITNKDTYSFIRTVPLKDKFLNTDNHGSLSLRAFEAITAVFNVTDYIESPQWFQFLQVPETLLPDEDALRRQSTPNLFENIVSPADSGQIGDPGFIIGGDSEGFVPPEISVRDDGGAEDGQLIGDVTYPFNNVDNFFESPTANFTEEDINSWIITNDKEYRITEIVSSDRARIESFSKVEDTTDLSWEIKIRPLAKRHKASFVILNDYLKHQLFSVTFDTTLTNVLPSSLIADLEELVLVAKPAYTTLIVTPSTLFEELIIIQEEDLESAASYTLGGVSGESLLSNTNTLLVVGESWYVGSWFRLVDRSSGSLGATSTSVQALAKSSFDEGHIRHVNHFLPDFDSFKSGGDQLYLDSLQYTTIASFSGNLEISIDGDEVQVIGPADTFDNGHLLLYLNITSGSADNQGRYKIGRIVDNSTVVIVNPNAVEESGLDGEIQSAGTTAGRFFTENFGESYFEDLVGKHEFDASHVGTYIRKTFSTGINEPDDYYRIAEVISSSKVRLAKDYTVSPIFGTNVEFSKNSRTVTFANGHESLLSPEMANKSRPSSTRNRKKFYVAYRGSDPDSISTLNRYLIEEVVSKKEATVDSVSNLSNVYGAIEAEEHYALTEDTPEWEHVKRNVTVKKDKPWTIDIDLPDRDSDTPFSATGVQEPDDFELAVRDPAVGDTLYSISMVNPKQITLRSRTGRDIDMREEPIQISMTNSALTTEDEEWLLTEDEEVIIH